MLAVLDVEDGKGNLPKRDRLEEILDARPPMAKMLAPSYMVSNLLKKIAASCTDPSKISAEEVEAKMRESLASIIDAARGAPEGRES